MARGKVQQPPEGYEISKEQGRYFPVLDTKSTEGNRLLIHIYTYRPELGGRLPISYAKRSEAVKFCERHKADPEGVEMKGAKNWIPSSKSRQ